VLVRDADEPRRMIQKSAMAPSACFEAFPDFVRKSTSA
jgi:hypothetical protein